MKRLFDNTPKKIGLYSYIFMGTLLILSSLFLNPWNHYLNALLLILGAVGLYFFVVITVADGNWLDIRGIFTAVWLGTLGLAALRLSGYQEPWQNMTWILCAVGYLMFQIGSNLGIFIGNKYIKRENARKPKWGGVEFAFAPNRLFAICVVTTLIGVSCFAINVAIMGFIPCFANDSNAYVNFYTKFHVFSVAATAVCGLCYYCIKTQKLSFVKKLILWIFILYHLVLFPILVVSRGVFVVSALAFTTVVFYLNKRKLWVLILCVAFIAGTYMLMSNLRSLADWQLNAIFEPNQITIGHEQEPSNDATTDSETEAATDPVRENDGDFTFALSPKLAFLYGYLTVSHDNFNEAVKNLEGYTWGVRQLAPFNVLLRQQWITDTIEKAEYYQVNIHLNTTNMMGIFYYDLHEIGVVIFMLLWSCLFGALQTMHLNFKGPFSLMILGYVMAPVTLSFFAAWVDSFDLWMFCGTVLIFAVISCIHVKRNGNRIS